MRRSSKLGNASHSRLGMCGGGNLLDTYQDPLSAIELLRPVVQDQSWGSQPGKGVDNVCQTCAISGPKIFFHICTNKRTWCPSVMFIRLFAEYYLNATMPYDVVEHAQFQCIRNWCYLSWNRGIMMLSPLPSNRSGIDEWSHLHDRSAAHTSFQQCYEVKLRPIQFLSVLLSPKGHCLCQA